MSSGRTTPSCCFRISLLPHTRRPSALLVSFLKLAFRVGLANLFPVYTAGVRIRFTTSFVNGFPSRSCNVSLNTIESTVILTTYPLNTGSFSRRKYALFSPLVTTAIMPLSDFTTPCNAICSMSRHFLPVLQPDPPCRFTTGLRKGSRLPVIEYFLSSCLPGLEASASEPAGLGVLAAALPAGFAATFTSGFAATFTSGFADAFATFGAIGLCALVAVCVLAGAGGFVAACVGAGAVAFAGATLLAGAVAAFTGATCGLAGTDCTGVFAGTIAGAFAGVAAEDLAGTAPEGFAGVVPCSAAWLAAACFCWAPFRASFVF